MITVESLIKDLSKMPKNLEVRIRYPTGFSGEPVVKRINTQRLGKIEVDEGESKSGKEDYVEFS